MHLLRFGHIPCEVCQHDTLHIKQKCQECGSIFLPKTSCKEALARIKRSRFKRIGRAAGNALLRKRKGAQIEREKMHAAAAVNVAAFCPDPVQHKDAPADTHGRGLPRIR